MTEEEEDHKTREYILLIAMISVFCSTLLNIEILFNTTDDKRLIDRIVGIAKQIRRRHEIICLNSE